MSGAKEVLGRNARNFRESRAGHARCSSYGMDPDLRYERPVKWLLAAGAAINWVAAMLVVLNSQEVEYVSRYAGSLRDAAHWLLNSLG